MASFVSCSVRRVAARRRLLRIVAGLESASGGTVDIDTTRVDLLPPQERDVAFVFQNYALYPHMTVFENLGFSLRLHGVVERGDPNARHRGGAAVGDR